MSRPKATGYYPYKVKCSKCYKLASFGLILYRDKSWHYHPKSILITQYCSSHKGYAPDEVNLVNLIDAIMPVDILEIINAI